MSLNGNNILSGASGQATGYEIEKSVVLGDSAYFSRTPSSAGNRQVFTISAWVKLGSAAADDKSIALMAEYTDDNNRGYITFGSYCRVFSRGSGSDIANYSTDATFRDPSAWYHVVFSIDVTQSTAANRVKIYVNGIQQDITISSNFPEDTDTRYNVSGREYHIGKLGGGAGIEYADGYVAEYHFIDGTALDASSFGETNSDTNQWVPIEYTGSYGTNGFYLDFATRATDPIDASGNGNNWSSSNVVATDWRIDTPTNNFATLNPLASRTDGSSSITLSEGNLKISIGGTGDTDVPGTIPISSGKWYAEVYAVTLDGSNTGEVGITESGFLTNQTYVSSNPKCTYLYSGRKRLNGSSTSTYGASWSSGDIVGIALNLDDNEITFYKNNSSQGAISITADEYVFTSARGSGTPVLVWNFGQDSSFAGNKTSGAAGSDFYYTPPTGFVAFCSDNLSDPSIADPTDHFNTVLYTGNNGSNQSVTGVGFQPDFLWIKPRDYVDNHGLIDSVRGGNYNLWSNSTSAEQDNTGGNDAVTLDSDGFTVNQFSNSWNRNGYLFVGWNWKAGGTASSNTDGTITSSVSANPTAGFSIVSYTGNGTNGATVGHGLSQKPDLVIYKARSQASHNWIVYSSPLGATKRLKLDLTDAESTSSSQFNDTEPTSSVVTLGTFNNINQSSETFIAYAFHSVGGFSKIGSYRGNSNADGPMFYCDFKPAWAMFKATGSAQSWTVFDNKRNVYNLMDNSLFPDLSNAENDATSLSIDFVSNGIKIRSAHNYVNYSGSDYLVLAFAESPFKTSNAR